MDGPAGPRRLRRKGYQHRNKTSLPARRSVVQAQLPRHIPFQNIARYDVHILRKFFDDDMSWCHASFNGSLVPGDVRWATRESFFLVRRWQYKSSDRFVGHQSWETWTEAALPECLFVSSCTRQWSHHIFVARSGEGADKPSFEAKFKESVRRSPVARNRPLRRDFWSMKLRVAGVNNEKTETILDVTCTIGMVHE